MATWPDGRRVAFEVQYAPLTPEAWRARHESNVAMGIPCVWLLGHLPTLLKQARGESWLTPKDAFSLAVSPLHEAMVTAGVPLLWINPVSGQIATAETITQADARLHARGLLLVGESDELRWHVPVTPDCEPVVIHVSDLAACTPTTGGLNVPRLEALASNLAALEAINAQTRARNAELEGQLAEEAARAAATRDRRRHTATRLAAQREQEWNESDLRAAIVAKHGRIPEVIAVAHQPDLGVFAARERWHAILYRELIHQRIGTAFTFRAAYRALAAENISLHKDGGVRARTILSYLEALEDLGYLTIEYAEEGWRRVQRNYVLADLNTPPTRAVRPARAIDEVGEPPWPSRKRRRPKGEVALQAPKPPPTPPKPTDPMPDYSAELGYVRNYLPGIDPVQMWHRRAVDILREQPVASLDEFRHLLGVDSDGVTDHQLLRSLTHFRH